MRDEVTIQCPQTTTFEEKEETKRIRTEVPLLTRGRNATIEKCVTFSSYTALRIRSKCTDASRAGFCSIPELAETLSGRGAIHGYRKMFIGVSDTSGRHDNVPAAGLFATSCSERLAGTWRHRRRIWLFRCGHESHDVYVAEYSGEES